MSAAADRVRALDWSPLQGLSLEAPLRAILSGAAAERVLDRFLRDHRGFGAEQRRACAEAFFGVGLWRRRLKVQAQSDEPLALLLALTHLELDPPVFADRHSLPDWLAAELQRTPEPEALADALNQPGPICLRARDDRAALAQALEREHGILTRPGRLAPQCLVVTSPRPNLLGLGRTDFEVQDEGSQWLGERVQASPGDTVLDLCAGAGGKTLQLLAALRGRGAVHACDVDLSRLERLRLRAERAGALGLLLHQELPSPGLLADRVLVDAPCSELGALRRGPDLRWRIDPAGFEQLPALQLKLLERGAAHTRPGGRLVYATCTFRREENEAVALAFEHAHRDFSRAEEPLHTWPHVHGTDGFFASTWSRRAQ